MGSELGGNPLNVACHGLGADRELACGLVGSPAVCEQRQHLVGAPGSRRPRRFVAQARLALLQRTWLRQIPARCELANAVIL